MKVRRSSGGTASGPWYLACLEAMPRKRATELTITYAVRLKQVLIVVSEILLAVAIQPQNLQRLHHIARGHA